MHGIKKPSSVWLTLSFALSILSVLETPAVTMTAGEQRAAKRWFDRMLPLKEQPAHGTLSMAYEDFKEGITRGGSWQGGPYKIAGKSYTHGIAYNSVKHIRIHTSKPAERFVAEIGLEDNNDTVRGEALGNGSVTFHVLVSGKEVFTSPVMRRTNAPARLDIPLGGVSEFELRVGDAGDGRGWDQAVWAEAEVALGGGERLRLQDLPWADSPAANPFVFSFRYRGSASGTLAKDWPVTVQETNTTASLARTIAYQEPGGIEVRVEAIQFHRFPAVEWVVHISNRGASNSPLVENIQPFDGMLPAAVGFPSRLHWARGAVASFDDFAPEVMPMKAEAKLRLQPGGGRSSSQAMPFFTLEGAQEGVVTAIGWTGEWLAEFASDTLGQATLRAGMEHTRIRLRPGETIRTPRMLMLFYHGDRWRGQNLFRQFILAHHRPTPGNKPLIGPITCGNWGATKAAIHMDNVHRIIKHNLPVDYYWIDAAWYGKGEWYPNAGNWTLNREIYPDGMQPLGDTLRANQRHLMLWFEPERVYRGTEWHRTHPDFLIGPIGDNLLLNLGHPEARKFVTDFIDSRIKEYRIGCYRQDFNIDPLPFWKSADAPDRQGITEIRYIEGLYQFWDDLLSRNPGLIIDNCASGGRRLDLETLGRATPFWRSDGPRDAVAHQCHTWGLMPWVPLNGTSQDRAGDTYEFRSSMSSTLCLNWWVSGDAPAAPIKDDFPFEWCRKTLAQYLSFRDFYYGDFYPLTTYTKATDAWFAWQFNRPDKADGIVILLRRPESPYETARLRLKGIETSRMYKIRNLDTNVEENIAGTELLNTGLLATIPTTPGSAIIRYEGN